MTKCQMWFLITDYWFLGEREQENHEWHDMMCEQRYTDVIGDYYEVLTNPGSSVGKESTINAGDPGLIAGSGRSTGEGIAYQLQCTLASLVTQLVKIPPTMHETCVWSLDWEDPLEKGTVNHSSILAWRIHGLYSPWGCKELDMTEQLSRLSLWSNSHMHTWLMEKT